MYPPNEDSNNKDEGKNREEEFNRRFNKIVKKWGDIPANYKTIFKLLPVFIVLAAIPLTVGLTQQQQNITQEAAKLVSKAACSITPNPNKLNSMFIVTGVNLPSNKYVDIFIDDGNTRTTLNTYTDSTGMVTASSYTHRTGISHVSIVETASNSNQSIPLATCSLIVQ